MPKKTKTQTHVKVHTHAKASTHAYAYKSTRVHMHTHTHAQSTHMHVETHGKDICTLCVCIFIKNAHFLLSNFYFLFEHVALMGLGASYSVLKFQGLGYGVATMSRLFKIMGLFCKRALQKKLYLKMLLANRTCCTDGHRGFVDGFRGFLRSRQVFRFQGLGS